eukprot:6467679-Amphidinium_carterae.2
MAALTDLLSLGDNLDNVTFANLVLTAAATGGWPRVVWRTVDWLRGELQNDPHALTNPSLGYERVWQAVAKVTQSMQGSNLPNPPLLWQVEGVLRSPIFEGSSYRLALDSWTSTVKDVSHDKLKLDIPPWVAAEFIQQKTRDSKRFPFVTKFLEVFQAGGKSNQLTVLPSIRGERGTAAMIATAIMQHKERIPDQPTLYQISLGSP